MKSLYNVFILGDSYSTFTGCVPEGYAVYYGVESDELTDVGETWWHILMTETSSHLVMNNSWSGSAVSRTGYGGFDPVSAFVDRIKKNLTDGKALGEKINTVIIFGGTNDSWMNADLGEVKFEDRCEDDLNFCLPAFCEILEYLTKTAPDAEIINVVNCCIKDEIKDGMEEACAHYGAKCIRLEDLDLVNGHPTRLGMRQIADQIENAL